MYKEKIYSRYDLAAAIDKERLRYFNTLDEMDVGIAIINYARKYIYVNDAYISQMHLARENFIGNDLSDSGVPSQNSILYKNHF